MGAKKSKYASHIVQEDLPPDDLASETQEKPPVDLDSMTEEERQEYLEDLEMERMQEMQKSAVSHVVENLFAYAPVRIRMQKYPAESERAGEAYLWITLDEDAIKRRSGYDKTNHKYPAGVAIDRDGNVYVSNPAGARGSPGSPARKINANAIKGLAENNAPPMPPSVPKLRKALVTGLTVYWKEPMNTIVDRFDVQYRLGDSPNSTPFSLATSITATCATLDNVRFNTGYTFRVRAHNPVGWGEYSEWSSVFMTLPGPPSDIAAPFPGVISNTYICIYWPRADDNGSPIIKYTLQVREGGIQAKYRDAYIGSECSNVVGGLEPNTIYYFRVQAMNEVGTNKWIESRAFRTLVNPIREAQPLPKELEGGGSEHWIQCWDPKTEQVFFFNKCTCQRTTEEPEELKKARQEEGKEDIEEQPDMIFRKKRFRFLRAIRQGFVQNGTLKLELTRENMYEDTFKKFQRVGKKDMHLKPKIEFINEGGIDSGGLTKDWYLQISKDALEPNRHLFLRNEEGYVSINPDSFKNKDHLKEFRFIGKIIAKAVFDRHLVDLPLGDVVFKHLLALPVTIDDLQAMDPAYHKSLMWIKDNDITDIIYETFSVDRQESNGSITIIDLKENGRDIDVDESNKEEYIRLMVQWRTEYAVRAQLDALLQGIHSLLPHDKICMFELDELKLLINGRPSIDVDEIRSSVVFQGGYNENSQVVLWLWQALREFNQEYRGLFLKVSKSRVEF